LDDSEAEKQGMKSGSGLNPLNLELKPVN